MRLRVLLFAPVTAALLVLPPSAPAAAQSVEALTVDQLHHRYRRMSEVHLIKCDKNGDQLYTRIEVLCVNGIYESLYLDRQG